MQMLDVRGRLASVCYGQLSTSNWPGSKLNSNERTWQASSTSGDWRVQLRPFEEFGCMQRQSRLCVYIFVQILICSNWISPIGSTGLFTIRIESSWSSQLSASIGISQWNVMFSSIIRTIRNKPSQLDKIGIKCLDIRASKSYFFLGYSTNKTTATFCPCCCLAKTQQQLQQLIYRQ